MCLLCFFGEQFAELLWVQQQGIAAFCVAPPLLLAWLLTQPQRTWAAAIVGATFGIWLALPTLPGTPWFAPLLLATGLPLPPLGLAWLVRRDGQLQWPPVNFPSGARLLLAMGAALPALDVSWIQAWSQLFGIQYARNELLGLLLTHAGGYLLLVPITMALTLPHASRPATVLARDIAIALVLLALPLWLWSPLAGVLLPSALMTLSASALLLWMLVRFGLGGGCLALLACGVAGMAYSLRGAGPFIGLRPHAAALSMQAWVCAVAGALWLLSVALEQQRAAARRLCDAYRQLSDLTGRILVVQEEERTRIARDLHDDINQSLAALSIRLSYLKRGVEEPQREAVAEVQQELLKVSNDIRNMSHGLHPAMLRFTGLASALTGFCQGHGQRSTLRVHCDVAPPDGLGDARELSLFRIVQEALNNVEKHAHARQAWVQLGAQDGHCVLSISDDGIGPPCAHGQRPAGLGLISMGERARLLGGKLSMQPREGGGTHLEVRFPLPEDAR
ncbi:sensor histidine kinase [Stenotrophomonas panacihumi]|uniref:sensor histidine kinase n=1 Tax=Stenotrophomonas panacihumi TaxID=676599 RepID=UPI00137B4244|nr:sensor histidine kinase [Stenotrophomonas panacihumi]